MSSVTELVSDLESLADILMTKNLIIDASPLRGVRNQLRRHSNLYAISNLQFRTVEGEYVRSGIWHKDLTVRLSGEIKVNGTFSFSSRDKMVVDIEYRCNTLQHNKECKGCWHMDYHVMPGNPPAFMHPDFHLHHGGKKAEDLDDFGNYILIDNPRVMHHPLDVILGIDFIISNFFLKSEWEQLRADRTYKSIIEKAQLNWWKEYYELLGSYWTNKNSSSPQNRAKVNDTLKFNPNFI